MLSSAQLALVQPCHEICLAAVILCSRILGCLPFWGPVRTWHQSWLKEHWHWSHKSCFLQRAVSVEVFLIILRYSSCICNNKDCCLCGHYLGRQVPSAVRLVAFPRSCQGSYHKLPSFVTKSFEICSPKRYRFLIVNGYY